MSDTEDSFTILGSTPTPSIEQRINDESSMGLNHIFASSENCKLSHTTPTTAQAQSIQFADGEVALKQCLSVDNSAISKLEAPASKMDTSMPIEVTVYEDLIQTLETENQKLKEIIRDAAEQATHTAALEKELSDLQEQIKNERDVGYAEVFELNKQLSEKESIVKNQASLIERLEEKQQLLKVKSKLHGGECAQHITQEDHDRQIKTLLQEMSVVEAKKSELEILLSECRNQLKCLEDDQKVTQAMLKKNRTQIANHQKEMEAKNVEIKDLADEIVLLKSRSEMDLYGSYEGRTTVDLPLTASVLADHISDDRAILICPLCDDKSYKDLGALQEHVEACIMVEVAN